MNSSGQRRHVWPQYQDQHRSTPIDEISNYQLAIMGVAEDRHSANKGSSFAPTGSE